MVPGKYNITVYRGSTWSVGIEAADVNNVSTDFDIDYMDNGGFMRMHVRPAWQKTTTSAAPLLELTTANNRIVVTGTLITLTLTAAETEALTFESGQYDLELVSGDAEPVVDKILYGSFTVINEATQ